MQEWGVWYGQLGDNIVDGGAPFGAAEHITDAGVDGGPLDDAPATGCPVISVDSLDAMLESWKGHSHLKYDEQVRIFEYINMEN